MDACPHIGGAANDLQGSGLAHLHLAHTEFVGIGMGLPFGHKTHHHTLGLGGQILDGLHFKARQGQPFCQCLRLQGTRWGGDQLLQPLERDPHRPKPRTRPDPKE